MLDFSYFADENDANDVRGMIDRVIKTNRKARQTRVSKMIAARVKRDENLIATVEGEVSKVLDLRPDNIFA